MIRHLLQLVIIQSWPKLSAPLEFFQKIVTFTNVYFLYVQWNNTHKKAKLDIILYRSPKLGWTNSLAPSALYLVEKNNWNQMLPSTINKLVTPSTGISDHSSLANWLWAVDTKHIGSMYLCQIVTLSAAWQSRNQYSSDHTLFFQSSFSEPVLTVTSDSCSLLAGMEPDMVCIQPSTSRFDMLCTLRIFLLTTVVNNGYLYYHPVGLTQVILVSSVLSTKLLLQHDWLIGVLYWTGVYVLLIIFSVSAQYIWFVLKFLYYRKWLIMNSFQ